MSLEQIKCSIQHIQYSRRGQTEARGPHAARQRFLAAPVAKF
jgi:hypothetical protein